MITVVSRAVVEFEVECPHGETGLDMLPPRGLDDDQRREALKQGAAAAVAHHLEHTGCNCAMAPDPAKDWTN